MIKTRQDLLNFLKENNKLVPVTMVIFIEDMLQSAKEFTKILLSKMDMPEDLHDETKKSILIEALRGHYQSLLVNLAVVLELPEDDLDMEVNPEVGFTEEGISLNQGLPDWVFLFISGYVSFQECENSNKVAGIVSEEKGRIITERIEAIQKRQRELIETLIEKLDNKQKLLKEVFTGLGGGTTIN